MAQVCVQGLPRTTTRGGGAVSEYVEQCLRRGPIGDHDRLYVESPEFRAGIHFLAGILPAMIQGLADQARVAQQQRSAFEHFLKTDVGPR